LGSVGVEHNLARHHAVTTSAGLALCSEGTNSTAPQRYSERGAWRHGQQPGKENGLKAALPSATDASAELQVNNTVEGHRGKIRENSDDGDHQVVPEKKERGGLSLGEAAASRGTERRAGKGQQSWA
jgi:hypothetical protein